MRQPPLSSAPRSIDFEIAPAVAGVRAEVAPTHKEMVAKSIIEKRKAASKERTGRGGGRRKGGGGGTGAAAAEAGGRGRAKKKRAGRARA